MGGLSLINLSGPGEGLFVNDMIICVNGKIVGGMTELDLEVELDISGSELILVVSRCKISFPAQLSEKEPVVGSRTKSDILGWQEVGPGAVHDINEVLGVLETTTAETSRGGGSAPNSSLRRDTMKKNTGNYQQGIVKKKSSLGNEQNEKDSGGGRCLGANKSEQRKVIQECIPSDTKKIKRKAKFEEERQGFKERNASKDKSSSSNRKKTDPQEKQKPKHKEARTVLKKSALEYKAGSLHGKQTMSHYVSKLGQNKKTQKDTKISDFSDTDEWENDDNPWLGCVCGKTHPTSIAVFWIQCDSCEAWYNVTQICVGFSEEEAKQIEKWGCWGCSPPPFSEEYFGHLSKTSLNMDKHSEVVYKESDKYKRSPIDCGSQNDTESSPSNTKGQQGPDRHPCTPVHTKIDCTDFFDSSESSCTILPVGAIVEVAARTWPGSNKLGGVARITKQHKSNSGDISYNVRYVLGGTECGVLQKFIKSYGEVDDTSGFATPSSIETRSLRRLR